MSSGNITRTPDLTLDDDEKITNNKLNRLGAGSFRVDENAITTRELASSIVGGFDTVSALRLNAESHTDGQRIPVKGYYDKDDGDFGPDLIVDTSDTTTADDGLSCFVDANGLRYKRVLSEVDFKWAGAKGDGSTNDYSALNTALTYAFTNSVPVRPSKAVYMTTSEISLDGSSKTYSLRIEGNGATIQGNANAIRNLELTDFDKVEVQNMNFVGYGATDTTMGGNDDRLFVCNGANKILMVNCYGFEGRQMSFTGDAEFVEIRDCRVENSRRDAFNFTASKHLLMDGLVITNCGDDAIAFHVENGASGKQDKDWIINNIKIIMSNGIKGVATPNGIISNISGKRYKGYLIDIQQLEGSEGYFSQNDIIINNVVAENMMNLNKFGGGDVASAIRILGRSQAGTSPTVTAEPTTMYDLAGNAFVLPDDYEDEAATTHPVGPPHNVIISNVILRQYYPSATNYSDAGYEATAFHTAGSTDPAIGAFIGVGRGIQIQRGIKNCIISNFLIEGFAIGIEFAIPDDDFTFDNIIVKDGDISRIDKGVFWNFSGTAKVREMRVQDTRIDLDKYLEHTDHSSTGTWSNMTTDTGCAFVNASGNATEGILLNNCTVRNAKRRINNDDGGVIIDREGTNVMEVVSWDEYNNQKGVGRLPDHFTGAKIMGEDSDPLSATYQSSEAYHDLGKELHVISTAQSTKTTATITTDFATDANRITWTGHSLSVGDAVIFSSTTTLPDPLQPNEVYWVYESVTDEFELTARKGDVAYLVTLTDNGTGTHTAISNGFCFMVPDNVNNYFVTLSANRPSDPNVGNQGEFRVIRNTGSVATGWTQIGSGWANDRQMIYLNNTLTKGNSNVLTPSTHIGGSRGDVQAFFVAVDEEATINITYRH